MYVCNGRPPSLLPPAIYWVLFALGFKGAKNFGGARPTPPGCWGSETGYYYYLRHATHRLALPQSAHRVAVALSACIAVVSSR